ADHGAHLRRATHPARWDSRFVLRHRDGADYAAEDGGFAIRSGARMPHGLFSAVAMAAGRPELKVQDRTERGSRATRRLRRQGLVPGVVYGGKDRDCTAFSVDARELRRVLM